MRDGDQCRHAVAVWVWKLDWHFAQKDERARRDKRPHKRRLRRWAIP